MTGLKAAMDSFHDLQQRLANLGNKLDTIADHWMEVDAQLEDIHDRVDHLLQNATLRIEIKGLEMDWEKIKSAYTTYKEQVCFK